MTTNETNTLTEDEQFAALTKGNPLFDGVPETKAAPTGAVEGQDEIEDGTAAAPAGADGSGEDEGAPAAGAATPGKQGSDGAGEAAADHGQGEAVAQGDEPFPGYNELSQEARDAFDRIAGERRKYENDYRALHGMTAPLQRQNAELRRQMDATQARIQQLEQVSRKQQDVSVAKDQAIQEYEEWAKQFPEESRAMMAMVNPLREKVTALEGSLQSTLAELGTLHAERQQAALAREIDELEKHHADWRQIHGSPEYWDWLNRQTPGIQQLNGSMFAGDAIELLNMFKKSHAPANNAPAAPQQPSPQKPSGNADAIQQRRNQALARGTQPRVRTTESAVNTAGNPAMTDEDAQFASLVADNPNFR